MSEEKKKIEIVNGDGSNLDISKFEPSPSTISILFFSLLIRITSEFL